MRLKTRHLLTSSCLSAAVIVAFAAPVAMSNPQDGVVTAGGASITSAGSKVDIHQTSDKAIIDWRGFDIGAGETTQFYQPSSSSVTLNRVGSGGASQIDGNLIANGNIFIINPNGVLFGKDSKVDVNGVVASSADVRNSDFMAGNFALSIPGNPNASIENQGLITAKEAGLVGLVAPNVSNSGVIAAHMGRVHLASGDTATVDLYGDGLLEVAVSDQVKSQIVSNNGIIAANGGTIALTAAAGRDVVNSVVNVSGELRAMSVGEKNGKIIISAAGSNPLASSVTNAAAKTGKSTVTISGKLDVSGKKSGEHGGTVSVLADNITLQNTAKIDASGATGGGTILIGGDTHGVGTDQTALTTTIDQGATLNADALGQGDGGKVVLWSDQITSFMGNVSAQGGALGGNGGFSEISGKKYLDFNGQVNLLAANGTTGHLLLDPENVTIQVGAGTPSVTCTAGVCTPTADSSILTTANLQAALATSNVEVNTGSTGSEAGNITVANSISWSSGNTLILDAYKNIVINSGLTIKNTYTGTFGASAIPVLLVLRADATGINNGGSVTNNATIDFSGSTGAVSIFYDRATYGGSYTAGTQTANAGWAAPTNLSVSSQFTAYQLVNNMTDLVATSGTNVAYALGKNINAGGTALNGNASLNAVSTNGILDGQYCALVGGANCSITGLTLTASPSSTNVGLYTSNSGKLRNFSLGMDITQDYTGTSALNLGILAGGNGGTIANVTVTGNINATFTNSPTTGSIYIGGLTGSSTGTIYNARAQNSAINLTSLFNDSTGFTIAVGGLVGDNTTGSSLTNSSSSNNVNYIFKDTNYATATVTNNYFLGGLIGANLSNSSSVVNSSATGNVSANYFSGYSAGKAFVYMGGLAGYNANIISGSNASGTVSNTIGNGTQNVGGFVGSTVTGASIANSYATGATSYVGSGGANVGGFIGNNASSTITGSYATGNVSNTYTGSTGSVSYTGGFSGSNTGTISSSYSQLGTVSGISQATGTSGSSFYVGGFSGGTGGTATISNSYSYSPVSYIYQGTTSGTNLAYIGGFVGGSSSTTANSIYQSYATGNVSAAYYDASYASSLVTSNVGGFIGRNTATSIAQDFATGLMVNNLSGGAGALNGGFAGYNSGAIADSYAMGATSFTGTTAATTGSFLGQNQGTVATSFATGYVTSTIGTPTGFIGAGSGTATDSYFDTLTTGKATGGTGVTGLNTTSLQAALRTNFSGTIWNLIAGTSYPYLTAIFGSTPQVVSGTVFADVSGATFLPGAQVAGLLNGSAMYNGNTVTSGANGYYYMLLPNGTITNSSQRLMYLTGSTKGQRFSEGGRPTTGASIFGGTTTIDGGAALLSTILTDMATAQGSNTGANFTYVNTPASGITFNTDTYARMVFGADVNLDRTLTASGLGGINLYSINNVTQSAAIVAPSLAIPSYSTNSGNFVLTNSGNNVSKLAAVASLLNFSNGNNSFTVGGLINATGITTTNNVTLNAGTGTITTTQPIATGTGSLTMIADDLVLGGNLSGTGTLLLKPFTTSRVTCVAFAASGACASNNFNLSATEIAYLVDGWSGITVGSAAGTGAMYISSSNWTDPVSFLGYGIEIGGTINGTGDASFTVNAGTNQITSNTALNMTTAGGNINFLTTSAYGTTQSITMNSNNGNISILSGGTNIYLSSTAGTTADRTYSFNAGTGTLTLPRILNAHTTYVPNVIANGSTITLANSAWNGAAGLGNVTFTSVNSISLPSITTAAGKTVSATVSGAGNSITTLGAIATGTAGNITLTADDLILGGNLSGTGTMTLQSNSTTRQICINYSSTCTAGTFLGLSTAELAYFVDGWTGITIGRTDDTALVDMGAATFTDPVTIYGGAKRIWGALNGTGNASFLFGGTNTIEFTTTPTITTAGGAVTFQNYVRTNVTGSAITTNGGNVNFSATGGSFNLGGAGNMTVNSGNGNITFASTLGEFNTVNTGALLTLNAGTGTIAFGSTVNAGYDITANAATITTNGAWGSTIGLGNVSLTSVNSLALPAITTVAGKTVSATVSGTGNNISTTSAIATGAGGNITLAADDLMLGGNLSGTGTLTLKPVSAARAVRINSGTDNGTFFYLSTAELAYLVDGWSQIVIGNTNNNVGAFWGDTSWSDPVKYQAASGQLEITGNLIGTDNASFTFALPSSYLQLKGAVTTNGGAFSLTSNPALSGFIAAIASSITTNGGAVTLGNLTMYNTAGSNVSINSGGGNITIGGVVKESSATTNARSLTLNAGSGTLAFGSTVNTNATITGTAGTITTAGAWGGTTALDNVTLTAVNALTLPAITTAAGKTVSATVTGAGNGIIVNGAIATGTGGNVSFTADDVDINAAISGTGTALFQSNAASRIMNINAGSATGNFFLNGTELGLISNGFSSLTFGNNALTGGINVGTFNFGSNVNFLTNSGYIRFGSAVTLASGLSLNATSTTGSIGTYTGGSITASGAGNITLNTGGSLFGNELGTFALTTATGNINLTGTTSINNLFATTATSSSGNINVNNNLTLGAAFTANAGTGNVVFGGSINGGFDLSATGTALTLPSAIGGTAALGNVTLNSVNSLTLPAITTVAGKTVAATVSGAGNSITTNSAIATGAAGNITLTADDLIIGANLSGTGTVTLQPYTSTRGICVNYSGTGCTTAGTYLGLSTAEIAYLVDGWSSVVIGTSGVGGAINIGTSTWTDPTSFLGSSSGRYVNGALTGTGNASFNITGGSSDTLASGSSITTAGGNVVLGSNVSSTSATITTNGGNFSTPNQIYLATTGTGLTINTSGGNIFVGDHTSGGAAGQTVTFNAGTGTVSLRDLNGPYDLSITGNSASFVGASGATTGLGNVTINAVNSISIPAFTTAAGKTFAATVTGAGNSITTTGAVATGTAGNITLTADDLILGGNLSGTGALTLAPYSNARQLDIGKTGTSDFNLSATELGYFTTGWGGITIGKSTGTSSLLIGAATFTNPVTFLNGTAPIYIDGALTGTGNASITFGSTAYFRDGSITTAGQNVNANSSVSFERGGTITTNGGNFTDSGNFSIVTTYNANPISISTTSGNITIGNVITEGGAGTYTGKNVTLNAGTGNVSFGNTVNTTANITATGTGVTFNGVWGGSTALGDVVINSINSLSLPSLTTAAGKSFTATASGAGNSIGSNTFNIGALGNLSLTADDIIINGPLNGTGTLTIQPYSTTQQICINIGCTAGTFLGLSTAEVNNIADGWGSIQIGRTDTASGTNTLLGTTTWKDPMSFRTSSANSVYILGAVTGTGDAAFTFGKTWMNTNGSVTTAGQNVNFLQNLSLEKTGSVTTNGGNISIGSGILYRPNSVGQTLTMNAGTGTITINGAVDTLADIVATAASIITNTAWGATNAVGNVTLNVVNSLSLPAITTQAGKTVSATVSGAGNSITTTGAIATGAAGNITLTADDLALGGNLSGTGTLTLKPYTSSRDISVNNSGTGNFNLNSTEIGYFVDGWSNILIGRADGTGNFYVSTTNWTDPVTFLNNAAEIINGNVVGTDNASLNFSNGTANYVGLNSGRSITTAGQNITISGTLVNYGGTITTNGGAFNLRNLSMAGNFTANTGNGNINISNNIVNQTGYTNIGNLATLNAGTGTVSFGGNVNTGADITATGNGLAFNSAWGSSNAVGNVNLTSVNSVSLPAITTQAGNAVNATVSGAGNNITTTGAIATGAAGNITLTADDLILGANLSGTGNIKLQPYSTSRVVCVNYTSGACSSANFGINTTELSYLPDGWGTITIGRTDGAAVYVGAATFSDPTVFASSNSTSFNGALTGTDNASFTVAGANSSGVNLYSTITTAGGKFDASAASYFYLTGTGRSITTNGGNILLPTVTTGSNSSFNLASGNGNITLTNITGASVSNTSLTANAGTGTLTFGGYVDGAYDITGTANSIVSNNAWGGTNVVGNVTLNSVNSMSVPSIKTAAGKTVALTTSGAGNSITTNGAIATGAGGNITLTADDLTIGANLSGTGVVTLQPYTPSRVIRVNFFSNDFNLDSTELARLVDGWSLINIGRVNGSDSLLIGDATFSDPVSFRNNYGIYMNSPSTTLTGTDNASFTFGGNGSGWLNLSGSIVTNGGAVTDNYTLIASGGNITTNGGNVSLGSLTANAANLTINSGNGNITVAGVSQEQSGSAGSTITMNAGTGTLSFGDVINGAYNLIGNAASIAFNGALGNTTALGNVTLTSAGSLTLPSIKTAAGKTVTATVTGAGNSISTGAIATGTGGNITLISDDVAIGGNLSGTGTVTLQPYTASRAIDINTSGSNDYNLTTAEISKLVDGWSSILIGSNGGGSITTGNVTFTDPTTFRSSDGVNFYGDLTGTDNTSFTFTGPLTHSVTSYGNIMTAGGAVDMSAAPYFYFAGPNRTISTSGGAILMPQIAGGTGNLILNSGNGNIAIAGSRDTGAPNVFINANAGTGTLTFSNTFDGAYNITANANSLVFGTSPWGGSVALGDLSFTSANGITLPSINAASLFARTTGAASDITIGSGKSLAVTGTGNALTLAAGRDFINGGGANGLLAPNGRWLVYSANPTDTTGEESLANNFNRYSCAYNSVGTCAANATLGTTISIPTSGNGLIYSYTPTLTATPTILADVTYGDAVSLNGYGYNLSGYLNGDVSLDTITGSLNGSTSYAQGSNIGTHNVNYASGSLASALGYQFSYANNASAINVIKRILTTTLTGTVSKTYDGTTDATLAASNYNLSNVYGSDDVSISTTAGSYDTKNAGSGKTVSVSGLTLAGSKMANYALASTSTSGAVGTIAQRALTIIASGIGKIYDGTTTGSVTLSDNRLSGDVFTTETYGAANYLDKNAGTGKTLNVTGINITGGDAGNYSFNTTASTTASISQRALTIGATGVDKTYDATTNGSVTLNDNRVSGDVFTAETYGAASYLDKNAGTGKTLNVSGLSITGGDASNYTFNTTTSTTATINKKTLDVTLGNQGITYGDTVPTDTYSYNGFAGSDSAADIGTAPVVSSVQSGIVNAGTYLANYTANGGVATNYSFNYIPGNLTVVKKTLNVTADNQTINYGIGVPTTTFTYNGFITGENASFLTTVPTGASAIAAGTVANAGTYTGNYTVSGGSSNNYAFNYLPGTLTVNAIGLNVTANNQTVTYGTNVPAGSYSYNGFVNGDTAGNVVTSSPLLSSANSGLVNAGLYAGNYTVSGGTTNGNYYFNYGAGDLTVSKKNLIVTADNQAINYGMTVPTTTFTYNGFITGQDASFLISAPTGASALTVGTTPNAGSYVGNYTVNGGASNNYSFSYVPGNLTISTIGLNVIANNQSVIYGTNVPTGSYSYSGFVNGDTASNAVTSSPTLASAQNGIVDAGNYAGNYTVSGGTTNGNYTFNYLSGNLTVTKKMLNVTADNQIINYGIGVPNTTLSYNGFISGQDASFLTTAPTTHSTIAAGTVANAGTYAGNYTVSGGAATNYDFNYIPGSLTISPIALNVTAANQSITYGTVVPTSAYTYSGFVNGDTSTNVITSAPLLASAQSGIANANTYNGNYTISGGATNGNYFFNYIAGDLAIAKKTLNVIADNQTINYGTNAPTGTFHYTGFVNGENASVLDVAPTLASANTGIVNAGTYNNNYSVSGGSDNNYSYNYATGNLNVSPKLLTITANNQAITYGTGNVYNGFYQSGLVGSETLTGVTYSTNATTSSSGNWNASGTPWSIGISNATGGNGFLLSNYTVTYNAGTLMVTPRALTVAANGINKTYDGGLAATATLSDNRLAGDVFTDAYSAANFAAKDAGTSKTITVSGISLSGTDAANYTANTTATTSADIAKLGITVTANNGSKIYGDADALTYVYSALASGDTASIFTGSLARAAGENVGSYLINQGTVSAGNNYTITYNATPKNYSITPRDLTIDAGAKNKLYGSADPALTYTHGLLYNGDTASVITGNIVRDVGENAGVYAINQGTLSAGSNYTIHYTGANFTINAAALNLGIFADATGKFTGQVDPTLTFTHGALLNGDTDNVFTGALARDAGELAGSYMIRLGSLSAGPNYVLVFTGNTFTITNRTSDLPDSVIRNPQVLSLMPSMWDPSTAEQQIAAIFSDENRANATGHEHDYLPLYIPSAEKEDSDLPPLSVTPQLLKHMGFNQLSI